MAHNEDIDRWVLEVEKFISDRRGATLLEIVGELKLTKVQILLPKMRLGEAYRTKRDRLNSY